MSLLFIFSPLCNFNPNLQFSYSRPTNPLSFRNIADGFEITGPLISARRTISTSSTLRLNTLIFRTISFALTCGLGPLNTLVIHSGCFLKNFRSALVDLSG